MVQPLGCLRQSLRMGLVATVGCGTPSCHSTGFEQLTDDAPRNVYFPGKALGAVPGGSVPVALLGLRGVVSAVVTQDPNNQLAVHRFDGSHACTAGSVAAVGDPFESASWEAVDQYFAYQKRLNETTTELRVVDDHCREPLGPYRNATMVGPPPGYIPTALIVLTEDHRLLQLHPETETESVVATGVTQAVKTSKYLYAVEDGRIKIRDRSLETLATVGHKVTELSVDRSRDRVAFIDEHGLSVLRSVKSPPIQLDSSACSVDWSDAPDEAMVLQYWASCSDRTLVANLVALDRRVELPEGALPPVAARNFGTSEEPDWVLSYFMDSPNGSPENFVGVEPDGKKFTPRRRVIGRIDEPAVEVGLARTYRSLSDVVGGLAFLWLDPGTASSRLVAWSPSEQSVYIDQVMDFSYVPSPMRVTVRNGSRSDLVAVVPLEKPQTVEKNVFDEGSRGSSGVLVFSNTTNQVGQVSFLKAGSTGIETLFQAAYLPSSRLVWDESAASALAGYSPESRLGELCVRLVVSADTFCQPNVSSYIPTYRPALGIAYVSTSRGKATLNWAEAR